MSALTNIVQILKRGGYIVTVDSIYNCEGCILRLPINTSLGMFKPYVKSYALQYTNVSGIYMSCSLDSQEEFVQLPDYMFRNMIQIDILQHCCQYSYPPQWVLYNGKFTDISKVLISPPSSESQLKEGITKEIIKQIIVTGYTDELKKIAKTHGVLEGLELIPLGGNNE